MTPEEKKLLFKVLCEGLPYGLKCWIPNGSGVIAVLKGIVGNRCYFDDNPRTGESPLVDHIKPYLRPISSMIEEEMDKLFDILNIDKDGNDEDWIKINDVLGIKFFFPTGKWIENVIEAYDYLNSIHIDYRGLIPMGLALEAPKGMYKEE